MFSDEESELQVKFVNRSKVFNNTSRRPQSAYKKKSKNPSEVVEEINERFGITENFLVDSTPINEIEVGDRVYTSYHGNDTHMIVSVGKNEVEINDPNLSHLKEGQFLKKEN